MYRWRVRRKNGKQAGYMLLLLMLAVAMLAITLLGVATNYRQSIRRDREVEMIHRGVQYERAVRLYYRKNNSSYPPSIDRLLETNKIRFLRKRYKDPMTRDGTWKIAHLTDVNLPAANTGLGTEGAPTTGGSNSGGLGTSNSGQGGTIGTSGGSTSGTDAPGPANTSGGAGEVLGGGPMIGVVSKSKQEGVHSFNDKSKYNEWLFVYLPSYDTNQVGSIPNGPFNPKATTTNISPAAGSPTKETTTPETKTTTSASETTGSPGAP